MGDDLFPRVVTVLNRGGRFESHAASYPPGSLVKNRYGKLLNLYQEKTAGVIHSGTGKKLPGYARHVVVQDYHGNEPTKLREGHDLALVTHCTIREVLLNGERIRDYTEDRPFPSALFLGYVASKPLHVVAACDDTIRLAFVITAYEPSLDIFEADYRTKRKS